MKIHWNILDKKRVDILPLFKNFSQEGFYLAGGTGLALLLGHRDSIDFDFFKPEDFDTAQLTGKLEQIFIGHKLSITQRDKNTISCQIDETILLSFLTFKYKMIMPAIKTEYIDIASVEDIACMKLSAISSRYVEKDYVDLYFISKKISLRDLISFCLDKFPSFNEVMILKSLTYIDDVKKENIKFKEGNSVSLKQIKKHFDELVKNYLQNTKSKRQ
jgi:hypothetical protein